jgi:hypothetical protein
MTIGELRNLISSKFKLELSRIYTIDIEEELIIRDQ